MGQSIGCEGNHRFFVAETVGVPDEGNVFVLIVCTSCGEFRTHSTQVSQPHSAQTLGTSEKPKTKKE